MGSEDEWIDIAAAAERESCSPQAIRRRIKAGVPTARIEGSTARDGRHVVKAWVRVSELDEVFGHPAREEHVRRIRATAQPLTRDQKSALRDRKSTRLNSSHVAISYAVFCLKKKKKRQHERQQPRVQQNRSATLNQHT